MKTALLLILGSLLFSCGVKAPPIAPEQKLEDTRKLNCSPKDPDCDATDPNYKPLGR